MENNIMDQSVVVNKTNVVPFSEVWAEIEKEKIHREIEEARREYEQASRNKLDQWLNEIDNISYNVDLDFKKVFYNQRKETAKTITVGSIPLISAFIFGKRLERKHGMKLKKIAPSIRIKSAIVSTIVSTGLSVIAVKAIDNSNL